MLWVALVALAAAALRAAQPESATSQPAGLGAAFVIHPVPLPAYL